MDGRGGENVGRDNSVLEEADDVGVEPFDSLDHVLRSSVEPTAAAHANDWEGAVDKVGDPGSDNLVDSLAQLRDAAKARLPRLGRVVRGAEVDSTRSQKGPAHIVAVN